MARGWKIDILITVGGVLLLLSHVAAWQLGRRPRTAAAGQAEVLSIGTREFTPGPADLVRLGREHEAAVLAATREQRELEKLPWPEQVDAARAKLPTDADFAALVREGMAAAKTSRGYASAETVAAFGNWLGLDPDAALDFIGRASRRQRIDPFRFEIGRWLGQGNEHRLDELVKRFPQAAWPLHQGAQELCHKRGADFALEMAASLTKPQDRLWLVDDCLDAKQWQGHLARVPAVLADPRVIRRFLSSISGDEDAAILLDEIRAAGFPPEDVAQAEARIARNEEYASNRKREEEKDRKQREESASALTRQLGLAGTNPFDRDIPSEEQQLEKLAPGFTDALADLCDGRQSMEEVLALVQRSWPTAFSDPTVAADLRSMLFDAAFITDPLGTLQEARATGRDFNQEAENQLDRLSPEMTIRVLTAYPEIIQEKEQAAFSLYFHRFKPWQNIDPEGCRHALLAVPDEVLRTQFLESYDSHAEEMRAKGGGP
ncbi:hypothetical protein OKA05_22150 [Luteolibacter arcticus]|uniref:Uncharacterized protein n=1 Tax=Luteolibacter arcticus TaxID=1581411 RepID=A0ABT3GP32_9BACT|nr:hypothetical protein [Luteolibacter arcticus]MCW1925279.1 hypothetical protein [Luteolibacter arcticus]